MGKIWWILFVAAVAFWLMLDKNADDFNYGNKQYYLLFQYYWKMLCLHVRFIMLDTLNFYALPVIMCCKHNLYLILGTVFIPNQGANVLIN